MMRPPTQRRVIATSVLLAMAAAAWAATGTAGRESGSPAGTDTYLTLAGPRLVSGAPF